MINSMIIQQKIRQNLMNIGSDYSLYVNYPFCVSRCRYCIYHIARYSRSGSAMFFAAYHKEIEMVRQSLSGMKFRDLHIGGGTPNLASPEELLGPLQPIVDFENIRNLVIEMFPFSKFSAQADELRRFNPTKIILGIQSMSDAVLRKQARPAAVSDMIKAMRYLAGSGLDWSVDLVFGLDPPSCDHLSEIEKILAYEPAGLHLYNLRQQKENGRTKNTSNKTRKKIMKLYDFQEISRLLENSGYVLVGDEWCRQDARRNQALARHDSIYMGESPNIGIGPGARSRTRQVKYRNNADLAEYANLLHRGRFPVQDFFDYKSRFFMISQFLLSINQSSEFSWKENARQIHAGKGEMSEFQSLVIWLDKQGLPMADRRGVISIPRTHWTRALALTESYLDIKSKQKYFYKN